jgi:NADH-quinone oxidoreductase subunit J
LPNDQRDDTRDAWRELHLQFSVEDKGRCCAAMSSVAFVVIAVFTLAAALAAATNPKLMHAALSFALAFVGVAAFYFLLGAEFVGLVQVFIYIGAVAVLVVFTILLTRREGEKHRGVNWTGALIAVGVFAGLGWVILKTPALSILPPQIQPLTVKQIGEVLMLDYVWPLMAAGVLLTVALLGALILALDDK